MKIPIGNLYRLLCYAWDELEATDLIDVGREDSANPRDLLASILVEGSRHVLRRGLDRHYLPQQEDAKIPRGRIEFAPSLRLLAARRQRLSVEFEDLSADTPANRVLKATARVLLAQSELSSDLREGVAGIHHALRGVTDIPLTLAAIRRVHLHRNSRSYRLLMYACELVFESLVPDREQSSGRMRSFLEDPRRMRILFEKFVRNFFAREQAAYSAAAEVLYWNPEQRRSGGAGLRENRLLPIMKTDVLLRAPGRTIVVDTKFTAFPFSRRDFGDGASSRESLRTSHLYQIYAYMSSVRRRETADRSVETVEGILLYPATGGQEFDHRFRLLGMELRAISVDLAGPWSAVRSRLLSICEESSERESVPLALGEQMTRA